MRHLLCSDCGGMHRPGKHKILATNRYNEEPAEYQRVIPGIALESTPEQRTIYINGEPEVLEGEHYRCDDCNTPIFPGDAAVARTVWVPMFTAEPEAWERDYITYSEDKA